MSDNTSAPDVIDGEFEEIAATKVEPPAIPEFGFSERAAQSSADIAAQVAERIKKHEAQLTEEELELWEQRLQEADTKQLEARIKGRRILIATMVNRYNAEFMTPETPEAEESKEDNA